MCSRRWIGEAQAFTVPDYDWSDARKSLSLVWNEETVNP